MDNRFIKVATPQVGQAEIDAVAEVMGSGSYVSGERVKEFERRFAAYIGTRHAIAVNSGTAALHIALQAMGISKGDEVIVPPLSFFATVSAVLYLQAVPVFADIDSDDLCLSPESVKGVITDKTKAILPVHLYGAPAKMSELKRIAVEHDIALLEDCAQAHGSQYREDRVGSIGTAGAFSFFATKHMTTGEGGIITTNDENLAFQARCIRSHGMTGRDDHAVLGFNNRMTEMEAAMGLVQLDRLDELNKKRIDNSHFIINGMKDLTWAHIPGVDKKNIHTFFWLPVMIKDDRNGRTIKDLKAFLTKNKIGFRHRYTRPLYHQEVLDKLGLDYQNLNLRNAEAAAGQIIGLPNHPALVRSDLDRILEVVRSF